MNMMKSNNKMMPMKYEYKYEYFVEKVNHK